MELLTVQPTTLWTADALASDSAFKQAVTLCLNQIIHSAKRRDIEAMEGWLAELIQARQNSRNTTQLSTYLSSLAVALATVAHAYCSRFDFAPVGNLIERAWDVLDEREVLRRGAGLEIGGEQARWCVLRPLAMMKAQDPQADMKFLLTPRQLADWCESAGQSTIFARAGRYSDAQLRTRYRSLLWTGVAVASALERAGDKRIRPFVKWLNHIHYKLDQTRPFSEEPGQCMTDKGGEPSSIFYWQHELNKLWACWLRGERGILTPEAVELAFLRCHKAHEDIDWTEKGGLDYYEFLKLLRSKMLAAAKAGR